MRELREGVPVTACALPNGWTMRLIEFNAAGRDRYGWKWGAGDRLWHLSDGADSLTIRCPSPVAALATVMIESWPPRTVRRYNWEYRTP